MDLILDGCLLKVKKCGKVCRTLDLSTCVGGGVLVSPRIDEA